MSLTPYAYPSAVVPVSADEIATRSYEQRYLIEEKIIMSLVETINQGIRDQVSHGLLEYEFSVPSFIYGFPKFDVDYVGAKLRQLYATKGFQVLHALGGQKATLKWTCLKSTPSPPPPRPPTSKTTICRRRLSHS
jgi:hypothetical protein